VLGYWQQVTGGRVKGIDLGVTDLQFNLRVPGS